ncbi:hypothetical protein [Deinococcus aquaticus]|uniref:Uncharacterized protein n=1 Tax=Deinococcus aquaticus TaxID=328692 RepID=A0ABY7V6M9_9DEIO|nr:hypothetical protein [Deinococcus aquaticus]WDA59572.1 hypothetical protein M8445_04990 [Deinococcus aquaticus]
MKPDLLRPLLGSIGLGIGFALYALAGRLPEPWQSAAIGGMFALLGASAWVYARGERWIQGLALLLIIYGLLRALVLR